MDVDAAPNAVSRAVVGVASGQPTLTAAYATYSVRITAPLGNAYTSGTQVVFLPLLLPIDDLDDITLRKGQTANINLFRHFLYSGGDQSDIVWSISPANSTQPVGYLSRSGTSVTIHASGAGRIQMVIGASAGGSTLRHTAYLTVTDANRAPVVSHNPPGITLKVSGNGAAIHPAAFFTDADGDTLTITAVASGVGVVLQDDGGGVWSVQPLSAAGTAQVVWTASDGHGGVISATQVFTLGPNRAPIVVNSIVPKAMLVSSTLAIPLGAVFSDPDNDALNYFAFSDDDDVASVDAGANQAAVLSAAWFVGSGGIATGATSVSLDATPVGFGGSVAFLIGAYLALGGQRAKITAATLVGSRLRLSDRQRVSTLTLTLDTGGYPLNVAAFTQMYLRGSRVALSGASIPLTAKATPSSTSITAIASDGTDEVSDTFMLIVHRAPIWQNIPDQSVVAGSAVLIDLARYAIEPDGDVLTFSVTSAGAGLVVSLRGADLYIHGLLASAIPQDVVVRATDVYGAFAEHTINIVVLAPPTSGAKAPLITRARASEIIRRRGEQFIYTAEFDGNPYIIQGAFPTGEITFFTADTGDVAATPATPHVIISDIDFLALPAEVQAELSNPNFYAVGPVGLFTIRGVLFQPWLQNLKQDSGHILWRDISVGASVSVAPSIAEITDAATLVTDLWNPIDNWYELAARADDAFILSNPDTTLYPDGDFAFYVLNDYHADSSGIPGPLPAPVISGRTLADYPLSMWPGVEIVGQTFTYTIPRNIFGRPTVLYIFMRYADASRDIYQDGALRLRFTQ